MSDVLTKKIWETVGPALDRSPFTDGIIVSVEGRYAAVDTGSGPLSSYFIPHRTELQAGDKVWVFRDQGYQRIVDVDNRNALDLSSVQLPDVAGFDVRNFGAVGGEEDDTIAFNDAIAAIRELGGGVLHLAGRHIISSPLVIDFDGLTLSGGTLVAASSFPADYMVKIAHPAGGAFTLEDFRLSGVRFDGANVPGVLGAISVMSARGGMFDYVRGRNFVAGGLLTFLSPNGTRTTQHTIVGPQSTASLYGLRFLGDDASSGFVTRTTVFGGRLRGRGVSVAGGVGIQIGDPTKPVGSTGSIDIRGTDTSAFETGTDVIATATRIDGYSEGDAQALRIRSGSRQTVVLGSYIAYGGTGILDETAGTATPSIYPGTNFHQRPGGRNLRPATLAAGNSNNLDTRISAIEDVEFMLLRGDAGGTSTVTGFQYGRPGRRIWFAVEAVGPVAIANQDTNSVEANRVITPTGASVSFAIGATGMIWYDGTSNRWRLQRG